MTAKETISKLHAQYYGDKKTAIQKVNEKIAKAGIAIRLGSESSPTQASSEVIRRPMVGSRTWLMQEAQAKGIKNFRVLNKEELAKVLDPNTTDGLRTAIVQGAVSRWKLGWKAKVKV